MKCNECGGTYVEERSGVLRIIDSYCGPLTVERIGYFKCDGCGDYLFSPEAAKRIEEARAEALDAVLQGQPLSAFVPARIAADMLGISRQALHKHRRIRRGVIFQTLFGDKTVYLRESILRFKKTGDGRFSLRSTEAEDKYAEPQELIPVVPYAAAEIPSEIPPVVRFNVEQETPSPRRSVYAQG